MSTFEDKSQDNAHIDFKLPESSMAKTTRPETKQKFKPKTNLPVLPNSVRAKRSGAVSRAGKHRWPQATMVVMGGKERQVFNTEMLTVTTHANKLEILNNDERSFEEKESCAEPRVILPDIVEAEKVNQSGEEVKNIPDRFTAKSPSKLSQLPVFSKRLLNQSSEKSSKESTKLIKSIKFWRGTTPNTQAKDISTLEVKQEEHLKTSEEEKNETDVLSKNDSVLQNWNEHLSIFEESSKNKYFSWQMALRNRLIKHEKMYYQEAVSRINKYRQQLKLKPHINAVNRAPPPNMDPKLWKSLLQQHGEKKPTSTAERPTGVSMSPTQEWKPYILKGNSKGQKKTPFFDASVGNDEVKKKLSKASELQPSVSSNRRSKHQPSAELTNSSYPVHGEALLKDEELKPDGTLLPNINSASPLIGREEHKDDKNQDGLEDEEKSSTRALLVDLKKQLLLKNNNEYDEMKNNPDNNKKEEISNSDFQGKAGLGMKLKLLLQNNSQNQSDRSNSTANSARETATARRRARSRLHSQQNSYRPISRPRTIGDGTLPKIHNIVTTSLWKRHRSNKATEPRPSGTKHRLTLAGVANRELFTSSVIGIAQKHIQERPKAFEVKSNPSVDENIAEPVDLEANLQEAKTDHPLSSLVSNGTSLLNDVKDSSGNEQKSNAETSHKLRKKKNPAYRLYTPATIQQHQFSSAASLSRIQEKENPQYRSLKLVTALSERQKSPPATPLEQFRARQQVLKGKAKNKKGGKSKVLRMAVVEPPLTAKERFERQQEAERSRKRLTFNPAHAALRNLSAAILNSELDLRAPSSSPVDMFFRPYYHVQNEKELADFWSSQKQNEIYHGPNTADGAREPYFRNNNLVNQMDGLMPPRFPVQIEGSRFNLNNPQTNQKPSTAPKLKDLVDLQKLYTVMQKHGEAYTNGSAYFYSPTPNIGLDGMSRQQVLRHGGEKNHNKIPFYYYPYHGDTNIQAVNESEGAPLYVVTGVNSMSSGRNPEASRKSKRKVHYRSKADYQPNHEEAIVETPFRHVLNFTNHDFSPWNAKPTASQTQGKHALTVVMPKTPGMGLPSSMPISQLEQIQEHVIQ